MQGSRNESAVEKLDRNWMELLQELRVLQTGVQILAGFLLTLPFQSRFETLDDYQTTLYLANVALAALTTALILLPVSVHRRLSGCTQGGPRIQRGQDRESCPAGIGAPQRRHFGAGLRRHGRPGGGADRRPVLFLLPVLLILLALIVPAGCAPRQASKRGTSMVRYQRRTTTAGAPPGRTAGEWAKDHGLLLANIGLFLAFFGGMVLSGAARLQLRPAGPWPAARNGAGISRNRRVP